MNAMKHYFDYECITQCGISKVKLLGTLEDWIQLKEATSKLSVYGLGWWTDNLVEILDKMIDTYQGNVDPLFWKYIFKYYAAKSGSNPHIDGWIINFIPYIGKNQSKYAKRSLKECIEPLHYKETRSEELDKLIEGYELNSNTDAPEFDTLQME